jgi:mRNA-degrading endonuclease RelE of RelBE toxin-antitoxin system
MSYQIESTASFDRAVKRLAKKYRHIKQDLRALRPLKKFLRTIRSSRKKTSKLHCFTRIAWWRVRPFWSELLPTNEMGVFKMG